MNRDGFLFLSWETLIAEIDRGGNLFLWHLTPPCAGGPDLQRVGCFRSLEYSINTHTPVLTAQAPPCQGHLPVCAAG